MLHGIDQKYRTEADVGDQRTSGEFS